MTHVRITRESEIPLMGSLYFGVIDRGTSLLQVRPSCGCNINCPFCSVDAGPESKTRATSYEVEMEYLLEACAGDRPVQGAGGGVPHRFPGEPLMYHQLPDLVAALREIDEVTDHLGPDQRHPARHKEDRSARIRGLDRINLSLHALDPDLSRMLAGVDWFDVNTLIDYRKGGRGE